MTIRNHLSGQRQSNRSQKSSPTAAKLWREFSLDAQCQKQENQRKSMPSYFADTTLAMFGPQSVTQGHPAFFGPATLIPVTDGTKTANVEVSQFSRYLNSAILDQEDLGRLDYQMTPKD